MAPARERTAPPASAPATAAAAPAAPARGAGCADRAAEPHGVSRPPPGGARRRAPRRSDGRGAVRRSRRFQRDQRDPRLVAGDLLLRHAGARMLAVLRECDMLARMRRRRVRDPAVRHRRRRAARSSCASACWRRWTSRSSCAASSRRSACPDRGRAAAGRWRRGRGAAAARRASRCGRAKAGPPGGFRFFEDGDGHARCASARRWSRTCVHALERGELELEYQPQFDIREPPDVRGRGAAALAASASAAGSAPISSFRWPRTAA